MPQKAANKTKMTRVSKKPIVREKRENNLLAQLRGLSPEDVSNLILERKKRVAILRKKSSVAQDKQKQKQRY